MARVCVEITFKLLGIHADSDLVKTYAQEHLFFRKRSLTAITTALKSSFSEVELAKAESDLAEVNAAIMSLEAKEMRIFVWAEHANCVAMYKSLYALLSGFVHTSSSSFSDWIAEEAGGDLVLFTGTTDFGLTNTLLSVATCIGSCLNAMDEVFQLGIHENLLHLRAQHDLAYGEVQGDTKA